MRELFEHSGTVLLTGPAHPILARSLQAAGYSVLDKPAITEAELLSLLSTCVGLVLTTRIKADRNLLQQATALQWIGRLGSGMELVDTTYAQEKGITCYSSPEGNRLAVAEHALGMILGLLHKIAAADRQVRAKKWLREENRGTELTGKTIGIIGYGNTGSELARLLAPFQVKVLAYDLFKTGFSHNYIEEASVALIQEKADIISLHVPLTSITKEMVDASFLHQLQKAPLLLNTARGEIISIPALLNALDQGLVRGAALDVLPNETLSSFSAVENEQLASLSARDNVLLTPHIAGYSHEAFERMAVVLLEKLSIKPVF
jgi:D-3-phosphoglycerate dehydrogenase